MNYGLVTGANRGLGLALLPQLLLKDPELHLFMGTRDLECGRIAVQTLPAELQNRVTPIELDVTAQSSLTTASQTITSIIDERVSTTPTLSLLINNAGVLGESESAEVTLDVNVHGAIATTTTFLPLLSPTCTIIFTSSSCGTRFLGGLPPATRAKLLAPTLTTDSLLQLLPTLPQSDIYSLSKLAINIFSLILSRSNPSKFIKAVSPGFTNTEMCRNYTGPRVPKSPTLGATVFVAALHGVGSNKTAVFVKQNDKAGIDPEQATSVLTEFETE